MTNAALCLCSLPAERMRGCQFAQRFWDKAALLNDAWVLSNNPTVDKGITVDGVNQKAEHVGPVLGVQSVSFWVTLGSTTEDILQLSAAHSIEVGAGTLTATGWAAPTITVNGIVTAVITTTRSFVTVTTATPFDADDIAVGEVATYGDFKMEDLKAWAAGCVLTLQEALDATNYATWDWENLVSVNLQMRTQDLDPVNHLTLDSSGHGIDFTLGNGAGANEPVQGAGRLTFAGAEYLERSDISAATWTIAETVAIPASVAVGYSRIFAQALFNFDVGIQGTTNALYYYDGAWNLVSGWSPNITHTVVFTYDGSTLRCYIDGIIAKVDVGGGGALTGLTRIGIDCQGVPQSPIVGDIFDFKYRDGQAWTPTQVKDYDNRVRATLGSEL